MPRKKNNELLTDVPKSGKNLYKNLDQSKYC